MKAKLPKGLSWRYEQGILYLHFGVRHCIWSAHDENLDELLPLALALILNAEIPVHESGIQLLVGPREDPTRVCIPSIGDKEGVYLNLDPDRAFALFLSGLQWALKAQQALQAKAKEADGGNRTLPS